MPLLVALVFGELILPRLPGLPGRALRPSAYLELDCERLRQPVPPHGPHQGSAVTKDREGYGLHPDRTCSKQVAQAEGNTPVRACVLDV